MKRLPAFLIKKQQMKHKLFMYMLILVILILLMLFSGLTILGQFTGEKQKTFDTLDFQNDIFSRQIESHFDRLAAVGIRLSNDSSNAIEKCLDENGLEFSDINNSEKNVADIQKAIFGILEQKLFEADCSGAFIVLNATVNKNSNDAENSRTGLYLQRSSIDYSDNSVLLYRGLSDLAKQRGIMPHRKWRLEFKTDCFPDYADLISDSYSSLIDAYRISDIFTLSGTDERVVLVTVPIIGKDKAFYGLCGFEISENYFKHTFNQPSKLNHAVFAFNKGNKGDISNENSFSCGITGGYYLSPGGKFKASDFGDGLTLFSGKSNSYIGSTKQVNLCSNGSFALTAIIPKQDYDSLVLANILKIFMLSILIIAATIGCSYFFARKFFSPIKKVLNQLKQKEYDKQSGFSEIDDLFVFLAQQDRLREAEFDEIRKAHEDTCASLENIQNLHNETLQHLERLTNNHIEEIDPNDFENFKNGLNKLTDREREIFNLYIAGNNVKQILEKTGLKESTIRFHNKNIYAKLGVHSLKQLLRFSTVLKKDEV